MFFFELLYVDIEILSKKKIFETKGIDVRVSVCRQVKTNLVNLDKQLRKKKERKITWKFFSLIQKIQKKNVSGMFANRCGCGGCIWWVIEWKQTDKQTNDNNERYKVRQVGVLPKKNWAMVSNVLNFEKFLKFFFH